MEEVDAGVVEVTISADLREVSSALANAEEKLMGKDGAAARVALAAVLENAIVDEEVVEDPLWAIHDHLALAANLIANENYDSARMALEHARKRLAALVPAQDSKGEAQPAIEEPRGEIAQIQADLSKKDPTLRERAASRLSSWMETVGTWFGKAESDSPASWPHDAGAPRGSPRGRRAQSRGGCDARRAEHVPLGIQSRAGRGARRMNSISRSLRPPSTFATDPADRIRDRCSIRCNQGRVECSLQTSDSRS